MQLLITNPFEKYVIILSFKVYYSLCSVPIDKLYFNSLFNCFTKTYFGLNKSDGLIKFSLLLCFTSN